METSLKQRLVGAVVLIALAVIFLPMLVQGPAPDSGVSDVPLDVPAAPAAPAVREIPLGVPGQVSGSATGMPQPQPEAAPATSAPAATFPSVAGGDYAVSFGSYASVADADKVIEALRSAELPAYREAFQGSGRAVQRVRIGPFADRAVAEAARLRAGHVRDDVGAQVLVLDAGEPAAAVAAAPAAPAREQPTKPAAAPAPKPAQPATVAATPAPATRPAPQPAEPKAAEPAPAPAPKPATTAASGIGYAVQVGALSSPTDATALRDRMRAAGFNAFTETVNTDKGTLTRVRVGPVAGRAEADALKAQVRAKSGIDGIVRPHP